jgi:hypothetical protein
MKRLFKSDNSFLVASFTTAAAAAAAVVITFWEMNRYEIFVNKICVIVITKRWMPGGRKMTFFNYFFFARANNCAKIIIIVITIMRYT